MKIFASLLISSMCSIFLCGEARAQSSVTLYGVLDEGVQYLTHVGANGANSFGIQEGNIWHSNFGFTGREDLGAGYAAIFKLESGINVPTGQQSNASTFFNRYSYVGLATPFGQITMGRQYSVLFDMTLFYDPSYLGQYSVLSTGLVPRATVVSPNSVKWKSANFGGFDGEAMYSFGQQQTGHMVAGTYEGAGLEYNSGSFSTRTVFEQSRGTIATVDTSSLIDRRFSSAAKFTIKSVTLSAGYANVSGNLQLSPNGNIYWAGLYDQASPALSLAATFLHYQTHGDDGHPNWFIFETTYNVSKSTTLYAYAAFLENKGNGHFVLNTYDTTSPGNYNQTGIILGVKHAF